MGFESGGISFRMFTVPKPLPADAVQQLARFALPSLETLGDGVISGWTTGRHMLDRNLTEDTARYAGFLRVMLVQAERKVPAELLRAECRMEEYARRQATGVERLSAQVRRDIHNSIHQRLLKDAQPVLKGIPMVYCEDTHTAYASCLSDRQLDSFQIALSTAIGFGAVPITPEVAAVICKAKHKSWGNVSFSPHVDADEVTHSIGMDFLMWLWFMSESKGGMVRTVAGDYGVMLEGPLQFHGEMQGAHGIAIKGGMPLISAETKSALLAGKKLVRAKVTMARGDEAWSFTLKADDFVFRSMKLPESEHRLDPASLFQDRMDKLDIWRRAFMDIFAKYAVIRGDVAKWTDELAAIHQWATDHKGRA